MFDTLSQLVYIFFLKFKNLLMKKKNFDRIKTIVQTSSIPQISYNDVKYSYSRHCNSTAILFIQEDEILITRIEFRTFDHESFDRKIYIYIYSFKYFFYPSQIFIKNCVALNDGVSSIEPTPLIGLIID